MSFYRTIVFDLDDTLYDFRSFWTGRLRHAIADLARRDPRVERATLLEAAIAEMVFMERWPDFLRRHGVTDEALITTTHAAFQGGWFDDMTLPEDAVLVLQTLRPRFKLGLITNGPSYIQRRKIDRFGLAERMDVLVVSGEFGAAKPDPAIFAHALRQLGAAPAEALFVGDSLEHDLDGATAAGMPFVWLNRHNAPSRDDLPAPVATIQRLEELLPLVEGKRRHADLGSDAA